MALNGVQLPEGVEPLSPEERQELLIHRAAERWHCTPQDVRKQPLRDLHFLVALAEADANVAEMNRAKDEARRRQQGR